MSLPETVFLTPRNFLASARRPGRIGMMMLHLARATTVAEPELETRSWMLPPYHVLIENDDHHSMAFVVMVLRKVFGYDDTKSAQLMLTAHEQGEAVVWTGSKEVAELKVDQIRTFTENHWSDNRELGPLGCRIEPAR
jgi:ATP-dependent Clp protease adaptor protein ClpS